MKNDIGPRMFLIYPGMTDFEEVEIIGPAARHGYCWVRPFGGDDEITVAISRLVDLETAQSRKNTRIIENRDDSGVWTTEERSVRII